MQVLITGVSSGLGRSFAIEALGRGHRVIGTVRRAADGDAFEALDPDLARASLVDVTDEGAMSHLVSRSGQIDAVIANAGYGFEGLFEESSMADLRRQFEVNVFGAVSTIRAVLPAMRARRSGHVLAVTSVGGLVSSPGLSFYNGSKFALEGILAALGKELSALGVRVTAIEPGPFRTDWSGRSMAHATRTISDYDTSYEPVRAARAAASGQQPGDPVRAARAVIDIIGADDAPAHLLLGAAALTAVDAGRRTFDEDRERFEAVTRSVDYPTS